MSEDTLTLPPERRIIIASLNGAHALFKTGAIKNRDSNESVNLQDVAAIVTIGHLPQDSLNRDPFPRGVARHYTEVFFADEDTAAIDLFRTPQGLALLKEKITALQETIAFTKKALEENPGKFVVFHCTHGRHRSPALGYAVLCALMGPGHEEEAATLAFNACFSTEPDIRAGEIAFLDAALGRDGKMISGWKNTYSRLGHFFDFDAADAEAIRAKIVLQLQRDGAFAPEDPEAARQLGSMIYRAWANGAAINPDAADSMDFDQRLAALTNAFGPLNERHHGLLSSALSFMAHRGIEGVAEKAAEEIAHQGGFPKVLATLWNEMDTMDEPARSRLRKFLPPAKLIAT